MIHLLSWNVRYFSQRSGGLTSTTGTLERTAEALAALTPQPDVIALQEIDHHSVRSHVGRLGRRPEGAVGQVDHFMAELNRRSAARQGFEYDVLFFRAHGHERRLPLLSTGLAVVFRRDIQLLDTNADEPWDITHRRIQSLQRLKQTRICAYARLELPGEPAFDLFNTHLSLPAFLQRHSGNTNGRFGEADNQMAEIRAVMECIAACGDAERSVLVGDFNARPGSRVYQYVCEHSPLRDAYASLHGLTPKQMEAVPSAGFLAFGFRLDHVFAGPKIAFESFPLGQGWDRRHPMRGLSDHAPIMGQFDVTQ